MGENQIDEGKALEIMEKIILKEADNLKMKKKGDAAMAKDIQKLVEEVV